LKKTIFVEQYYESEAINDQLGYKKEIPWGTEEEMIANISSVVDGMKRS